MYPRKIEYWMCSDGRTFPNEEQARDWESYLEKSRNDPSAYSAANSISAKESSIYDVYDVRF